LSRALTTATAVRLDSADISSPPAIESAHALAGALEAGRELGPDGLIVVNLSGRGVLVIADLAGLRGPACGKVILPLRLYWSPAGRIWDLDDPYTLREMYQVVLNEAIREGELAGWLNGPRLVLMTSRLEYPARESGSGVWYYRSYFELSRTAIGIDLRFLLTDLSGRVIRGPPERCDGRHCTNAIPMSNFRSDDCPQEQSAEAWL